MSTSRLAALEKLADRQAKQLLVTLEACRSELESLDQKRNELDGYARDYQAAVVGHTALSPRLLAHRFSFVAQLQEQVTQLSAVIAEKAAVLNEHEQMYRQRAAQAAAVTSLLDAEQSRERDISARREQRQQDEISQRIGSSRQSLQQAVEVNNG